jgi:hypothetical protein
MMAVSAAALGGHLVHVVIYGGSLLVVATVFGAARLHMWLQDRKQTAREMTGVSHRRVTSRSGWVQAAFLGLCAAAVTHLAVMPDHFRESWLYGSFFLCLVIGQLSFAGVLLTRPSRAVLLSAVGGSMAVVAVWSVSRFVGVPLGPDHGGVESIGVLDVLATLAELVTATSCLVALARDAIRPAWRWSAWSLSLRLALLTTGVGVPLAAALAPKG